VGQKKHNELLDNRSSKIVYWGEKGEEGGEDEGGDEGGDEGEG